MCGEIPSLDYFVIWGQFARGLSLPLSVGNGHYWEGFSVHGSKRPDCVPRTSSTSTVTVQLELLALLQQALVQSDEAGLDFVSIRISEAIDLLTVTAE